MRGVSGTLLRVVFKEQIRAAVNPIGIDQRQWEYRLWWTEKKLLSLMMRSPPMNKHRLAAKSGLHYTQVFRAVGSLLARGAIESAGKPRIWKNGKVSATYKPTSFGRFLHAFFEHWKDEDALVQTLLDLARYWNNHAIEELAKRARLIKDADRRRIHLGRLVLLIFEMQDSLEHDRLLAVSAFLTSSIAFEDLLPYAQMPEYRWLISEARKRIVQRLDEISQIFPPLKPSETRLIERLLENRSRKGQRKVEHGVWSGRGRGHANMGLWVMSDKEVNGIFQFEPRRGKLVWRDGKYVREH